MAHYPSDFLEEMRRLLLEEKTKLEDRIVELKAQDPFTDPERINDNASSDTEANEESSHDRFEALISELTEKLTSVVAALGAIDAGTYGVCSHCGTVIGQDRLRILPSATLCLTCEQNKI